MGFFSGLFGKKDDNNPQEPPSMPWDQHPSICEFVRSHVDSDKPGLTEKGYNLPDEERANKGWQFRWAPGGMDGVATHHMGLGENEENIRKTVSLVLAFSQQPTATNKASLYQHIIDANIISIIDPVIEALVNETGINHERLYELAYSFTTEAPDREPVKFGIAILGLYRQPANQELFQILGRHDEFTIFCAVALANASEDYEQALWTLARNVNGWGRIHVVERLAKTEDPAIKNWLLREGFRNGVMYEYLATTCARAGGLLAALSEEKVDRELLTSSGEILQAMIAGGPAEGIDDYEDAWPVVGSYLRHMETSARIINDFLHVNCIKNFLNEDESRWATRVERGWKIEDRKRFLEICESILTRPEWEEKVRAALSSENEVDFFHADQAAKALGLDTWNIHWQRLQKKPTDPGRWYQVMILCNQERLGLALEFAEQNLDFGAIATGPGNELGLGPGFEQHGCLDFILQELRRFPGYGSKFIEAGLKSPVVRNRNMAVNALAVSPRAEWFSGLDKSLEMVAKVEPDERVRERMQKVLRGEPLPE